MKSWIWGVSVLLCFAAGVGMGFVLSPNSKPARHSAAVLEPEQPAQEPPARPLVQRPPRTEAAPPRTEAAPAPEWNDPPSHLDPLTAALRAIELPPLVSGDGVIRGRVTTADGKPLPGVVIQLQPPYRNRYVSPRDDAPALDDVWAALTRSVRETVRQRLSRQPPQLQATTGADGAFQIGGLADGSHSLQAELAGFAFEHQQGRTYYKPGEEALLIAIPVLEVRIRVNLPPDADPEKCSVNHQHIGAQGGARPLSGAAGVWTARVQPGLHVFTASVSDPPISGEPALLHLRGTMGPQELTLEVGSVSVISGRVDVTGGELPGGTRVVCIELPAAAVDPDAALITAANQHSGRNGSLDGDGRFSFGSMPAGGYAIGLVCAGVVLNHKRAEHNGGRTEVLFNVSAPLASESIVAVVRTHDGRIPFAPWFSLRAQDGGIRAALLAWRVAPGEYHLQPPRTQIQPMPVEIAVEDSSRGRGSAPITHLGAQHVTLEMGPLAVLVVRFGDWRPPPGRQISFKLFDARDRMVLQRNAQQWMGDMVSVTGAPVGASRFEVWIGHGSEAVPLIRQTIQVEAEGTVVHVSPPTLHNITLVAADNTRASLDLQGEIIGMQFSRRVHYNGRPLNVTGLPPGRYTIKWRPPGSREDKLQYFDLPGPETINLVG